MALDLSIGITGELVIYKETKDKQVFLKMTENEFKNMFFFIIKRRVEWFKEIQDPEVKVAIFQAMNTEVKQDK